MLCTVELGVIDREGCRPAAAYYSPAMTAARPPRRRRQPRRRTGERALDTRLIRVATIALIPALLLLLLSVSTPGALPRPAVEPAFDGGAAATFARELELAHPSRVPGTPEAALAAGWVEQTLRALGIRVEQQVWREQLVGLGEVELRNVIGVIPGRSPTALVLVAHRDNRDPNIAGDDTSGTGALLEIARAYGRGGAGAPPVPQRTLVLVSSDGGAWGGAGAARFVERSAYAGNILAAVVITDLAGRAPELAVAAGAVASPARALVTTASARIQEQVGTTPALPSIAQQLVELGVPYAEGEQGPFLKGGVAAVTISAGGPERAPGDAVTDAELRTLGQLGRATESLLGSLDATARPTLGVPDALFTSNRVASGWALRLLLAAAVAPFMVGVVDLVARARRRRLPILAAGRALVTRLLVWLWGAALLAVAVAIGALPTGAPLAFPPGAADRTGWTTAALLTLAVAFALGWLLARPALAPAGAVSVDERLAGSTVALAWLGGLAVLLAIVAPYALLFVLPSLYAWLWIPLTDRLLAGACLFAGGFAGVVVGLLVLGSALDTGPLGALGYLVDLVSVGYLGAWHVLATVAWAAAAAQLGAVALGRYSPFTSPRRAARYSSR